MHKIIEVFIKAAENAHVGEDCYYSGKRTFEHECCKEKNYGPVQLSKDGSYMYSGKHFYSKNDLRDAIKKRCHIKSVCQNFISELPASDTFNEANSYGRFLGKPFDPWHAYAISNGIHIQIELGNYMISTGKVTFLHEFMEESEDTQGDFVFFVNENPNIIYNLEQLTNTETDTTKTRGTLERLNKRALSIKESYPNATIESNIFNPLVLAENKYDTRYGQVCGINYLMPIIGEPIVSNATFNAAMEGAREIASEKMGQKTKANIALAAVAVEIFKNEKSSEMFINN